MDVKEKIRDIVELRSEIKGRVIPRARDQYERSAFLKIEELLSEMEREYTSGLLTPKGQRYNYISRLVAESDPDVLSPELGGKLMKAERAYIESN